LTTTPTVAPDAPPVFDDAQMLAKVLDIFAYDKHALGGWLATFDDDERAVDVARKSYWHFNGFAKLALQAGDNHKVRLHVWPAGRNRLGESNPHGHRWNFASTILCGDGLRDVHYVEAETGDKYERYHYAGGNVPGAMTYVRTVLLAQRSSQTRHAGDRCMLDTSVVHTVQPLGAALIATLVIQGASRVESTPVYGIPGVNIDEPGRPISAGEVRQLIGDVLEEIN
jgi:hypothetical protein